MERPTAGQREVTATPPYTSVWNRVPRLMVHVQALRHPLPATTSSRMREPLGTSQTTGTDKVGSAPLSPKIFPKTSSYLNFTDCFKRSERRVACACFFCPSVAVFAGGWCVVG